MLSIDCRSDAEQVIYPADVVLVEGLLLFYFPELRRLFNMKIFVDTDPDTRLSRRGFALFTLPSILTNLMSLSIPLSP